MQGKLYGFVAGLLFAGLVVQGIVLAVSIDQLAHIGDDAIGAHTPVAAIDINLTNAMFQSLSWLAVTLFGLAIFIGVFERNSLAGRFTRYTLACTGIILIGFATLFNGMLYPPQVDWLAGLGIVAALACALNWAISDVGPWRAHVTRKAPDHVPASEELGAAR